MDTGHIRYSDPKVLSANQICVLMIYCVLNNIRFKIFLKEHIFIGCLDLYGPCHFLNVFVT